MRMARLFLKPAICHFSDARRLERRAGCTQEGSTGSGVCEAARANWRFTLSNRNRKIHHTLTGSVANTSEIAINCLSDSSSLTKFCGIKNVSYGRNATNHSENSSATLAHTNAAFRAHAFNWKSPIPMLIPEAISRNGTVANRKNMNGWSSTIFRPRTSAALFSIPRKKLPHTRNAVALPRIASAAAQVTPADLRVDVQADSLIVPDQKSTTRQAGKEYGRENFAQNVT